MCGGTIHRGTEHYLCPGSTMLATNRQFDILLSIKETETPISVDRLFIVLAINLTAVIVAKA